ncbi:PREDICTED: 21 kDa protein-like [Nelumbo nucifera]|uniref:21 kDa protein-like n=1 Tax=Nelumbo nucifera TaxID=4432 RepID=A0A1U7ZYU7_NELNU|nr:PREDICTED: 21 kDa protein-like [Nelumbo nucifera]
MARISFSLLLLLSVLCAAGMVESSSSTDFIKTSCGATRYPTVCVESLAVYANAIQQSPRQLAQTALKVSLDRAKSTKVFVSKMTRMHGLKGRQYQAVKDCVDTMGNSVDRLSRSIQELGQISRGSSQDFMWHMSNVQTWVSAALTDENTCMDGFAGRGMDGHVKMAIRGKIVNVAQVTSNALALVNQYASTTVTHKP